MFRTIRVEAELEKVSLGKKTKIGVENLAALVLEMGREPKKRKPRKREDIAFLETLYRLEDERA
jgi:hypothetical protein